MSRRLSLRLWIPDNYKVIEKCGRIYSKSEKFTTLWFNIKNVELNYERTTRDPIALDGTARWVYNCCVDLVKKGICEPMLSSL
ncbi:14345_t:CDS:2, partial [Gigaspora margarita]